MNMKSRAFAKILHGIICMRAITGLHTHPRFFAVIVVSLYCFIRYPIFIMKKNIIRFLIGKKVILIWTGFGRTDFGIGLHTEKHNSKLSREGRKICKELEKVLKAPVYYTLFYFFDDEKDKKFCLVPQRLQNGTPMVCPQCGSEWLKDSKFVRCEKCRLIAENRYLDNK